MIWKLIAKFVSQPAVTRWLIRRALKTPYSPIIKNGETYMERYWLFNPYDLTSGKDSRWPSIRLHQILLPDRDRHLHDHPWQCRTIILDGWYTEKRLVYQPGVLRGAAALFTRRAGDTATLDINDYHSIDTISKGGVWTMFITWQYQGTWGFLVDGKKVPYRKYLGL